MVEVEYKVYKRDVQDLLQLLLCLIDLTMLFVVSSSDRVCSLFCNELLVGVGEGIVVHSDLVSEFAIDAHVRSH